MTSAEYEQLVDFLGRQFTEMERGFGEVDRRNTHPTSATRTSGRGWRTLEPPQRVGR